MVSYMYTVSIGYIALLNQRVLTTALLIRLILAIGVQITHPGLVYTLSTPTALEITADAFIPYGAQRDRYTQSYMSVCSITVGLN